MHSYQSVSHQIGQRKRRGWRNWGSWKKLRGERHNSTSGHSQMNRCKPAWLMDMVKLALPYSAYITFTFHVHISLQNCIQLRSLLHPLAWEEFGVHLCFACSLRTNHDSTWTTSKHKLQHWKHPLMTLIPHLSTKHPSCSNGPLACFEIPPHYTIYLQHTSCWLRVSHVAKVQDLAHKQPFK